MQPCHSWFWVGFASVSSLLLWNTDSCYRGLAPVSLHIKNRGWGGFGKRNEAEAGRGDGATTEYLYCGEGRFWSCLCCWMVWVGWCFRGEGGGVLETYLIK